MAGSYLAIARRAAPTDPPVRNFTASQIPKGTEVNAWYRGVSSRARVSTGANKSGALEVKFFTTKGIPQKKTHKVNISAIDTINPEWNKNEVFSVTRVLDVLRKEEDSSLQFSVEWSNGQITREVEGDGRGYYDQVAASGAADTFLMEAFAPGVEGDCVKFAASGSGGDREVNVLASAIEFSNPEGNQCNDPTLLQPGAKILVLFELLGASVECSVIDGRVGRADQAKRGSTGKRKAKFISEDAIPEERQHHDAEEEDAEGPSSNVGKEKASPETSPSNSKREDEDDGMARRLRKLQAEVDQKPWMRQFYFGVPDKDIDALVTSGMAPERPFYDATTLRLQTYYDLVDTSRRHNNMEWLHQMNDEMMDDFVDVADDEKKFMKTWNAFIRRSHIIADREVPEKCTEFVATHLQFLRDQGLRLQLLLHLFNLWDSGVISSARISACMRMYDQGVKTNSTSDSETQGDGGVSQLTEATGLMDSQNVQHDSQLSAQPAETQGDGGVSQLTEATGLMDSQNVQHDSQLSAQPAETQGDGGVSQLTEATGLMDSQNVQHDSQLSAQPAETQGDGGVSQLTEATGLMDSQNVQHDSQLSAQPAETQGDGGVSQLTEATGLMDSQLTEDSRLANSRQWRHSIALTCTRWFPQRQCWTALLYRSGSEIVLGHFSSQNDAANAVRVQLGMQQLSDESEEEEQSSNDAEEEESEEVEEQRSDEVEEEESESEDDGAAQLAPRAKRRTAKQLQDDFVAARAANEALLEEASSQLREEITGFDETLTRNAAKSKKFLCMVTNCDMALESGNSCNADARAVFLCTDHYNGLNGVRAKRRTAKQLQDDFVAARAANEALLEEASSQLREEITGFDETLTRTDDKTKKFKKFLCMVTNCDKALTQSCNADARAAFLCTDHYTGLSSVRGRKRTAKQVQDDFVAARAANEALLEEASSQLREEISGFDETLTRNARSHFLCMVTNCDMAVQSGNCCNADARAAFLCVPHYNGLNGVQGRCRTAEQLQDDFVAARAANSALLEEASSPLREEITGFDETLTRGGPKLRFLCMVTNCNKDMDTRADPRAAFLCAYHFNGLNGLPNKARANKRGADAIAELSIATIRNRLEESGDLELQHEHTTHFGCGDSDGLRDGVLSMAMQRGRRGRTVGEQARSPPESPIPPPLLPPPVQQWASPAEGLNVDNTLGGRSSVLDDALAVDREGEMGQRFEEEKESSELLRQMGSELTGRASQNEERNDEVVSMPI